MATDRGWMVVDRPATSVAVTVIVNVPPLFVCSKGTGPMVAVQVSPDFVIARGSPTAKPLQDSFTSLTGPLSSVTMTATDVVVGLP